MGIMLDLFSSPPEKGYVEALREEATSVLAEVETIGRRLERQS
jgi:hypothetical protein